MQTVWTSISPPHHPLPGEAEVHDAARQTAGVVHDLGNLIQIASSALNIIARNPTVGDGSLGPVVARARTSLERAGALVRQTMGSAAQTRAPAPILTEAVCVRACLDDIAALLASLCEPRVSLRMEASAELPLVRCNRLNLQNAILNLVLNARDAMAEGGAITILLRPRLPQGSGLEIQVIDSGMGMSRETLERAFEPFFTTKDPGRSGGMGLAMVKRFTQEAGGAISIASAPGAGSTVTIQLPPDVDPGSPPAPFPPSPTHAR
jgi:signal transduction histidine kinase